MSELDVFSNKFSHDIFLQKYSMNGQETWSDTCKRVVNAVCGQHLNGETKEKIYKLMVERKFIPGGRYLYSAGRPFHQVNNCFLFRAYDSREGWADLMHKATMSLMTGGGIGSSYSKVRPKGSIIKKTGGTSTGPIALMQMLNEAGRHIMQGGQRRSAIYAGLSWAHADIFDFLDLKNWSPDLLDLKKKDMNIALPMEGTNISVEYDTNFFVAMEDKKNENNKHAREVWRKNGLQAFKTAEPGFSFNFLNDNCNLRNAPVTAETRVLLQDGYKYVGDIIDKEVTIWTGKQWAKTTFKKTKSNADLVKVQLSNGRQIISDRTHPFIVKDYKGAGKNKEIVITRIEASKLTEGQKIVSDLPDDLVVEKESNYGLGFVFGDGSIKNGRGELSYHTQDKEPCFNKALSEVNGHTVSQKNRGYFKTFYENKEQTLSLVTSPSFIAGWFDADGCYSRNLLRLSNSNPNYLKKCQEGLDYLGIKSTVRKDGKSSYKPENDCYTLTIVASSVLRFKQLIPTKRIEIPNNYDYTPYRESEIRVKSVELLEYKEDVYCCNVGVEEHSFMAEGVIISNCAEIVSEDDSDRCNLGTIWMNRFTDRDEFGEAIRLANLFLLCGGVYSDVPTDKIKEVGDKNNRIGLGLGGMHEWLLIRGKKYVVDQELHKWLNVYEQRSDESAYIGAKQLNVPVPIGKRAIAPTGTIGILAESSTGIEPLFCKAYKKQYLKGDNWVYQYVVDGMVKNLLDRGVKLEDIQDSYDITFKERVKFQADVQNYVDMAISSTCNLPAWGTEENNESNVDAKLKILYKYAKRLRGFTVYPDGARWGQPLTRVDLKDAMEQEGQVFELKEHQCTGGVCGV